LYVRPLCSTILFLFLNISYLEFGELRMSSWRAKYRRDVVTSFRMAMIPCAPYIGFALLRVVVCIA
jgi:hypothetical protein